MSGARLRAPSRVFVACFAAVRCATTSSTEGEPAARLVEMVEIAGAPEVDTSELVDQLAHHPPLGLVFKERARLDELALEIDRRRVESFFREQGYFAVEVADPEVAPYGEGVLVRFAVRPGAASRVRSLIIEGAPDNSGVDETALRALLELREGELFTYPAYVRGKERLRAHLFNSGYAHASVKGEVRVSRANAEAGVRYRVDAGPKVRFGRARMGGDTELPEESVLARADFEEGDPFDPKRLESTEKREYELSSVGSVRFDLGEQKSEVADVTIHVSDALPNELRLGGGVGVSSTRYELTGRASYLRRRFFHPLYSLYSELRPSLAMIKADETIAPNIEARAEIRRDDLFIPRLSLALGASFELTRYELYRTLGPRAYADLARPLFGDRLRTALRFELTNLDLSSDVPEAVRPAIGFFDPQRIVALAPAIAWDERDDLLAPKSGVLLRLEVELGRMLGEGGATWTKLTPEARGYLALGTERLIAAARVRAGFAFTGDQALPVTRRYFAGGSESQRGFGRRALAPETVDATGERGPVGGEAMLESSAELRLDIVQLFDNWLGLVAFVDAADVTMRIAELDPARPHVAVGPGLRYRTPIGPLRFDLGIRVNRTGTGEPEPDSRVTFHFSLGEAF